MGPAMAETASLAVRIFKKILHASEGMRSRRAAEEINLSLTSGRINYIFHRYRD